MRTILAIALGFTLAGPVPALARDKSSPSGKTAQARPAPAPAPSGGAAPAAAPAPPAPPSTGTAGVRPAPPPASAGAVRPAPGPNQPYYYYPRRGYYPYGYYPYAFAAPIWWGWGWGYGYYPLYPRPPYPYRDEPTSRVTTSIAISGGPTREGLYTGGNNGAAGHLSLAVEGERLGFEGGISGFTLGKNYGFNSGSALGMGTAHLTYALLAGDAWRLRLEMGGSMVSWPDKYFAQGPVAFGLDFGVSGNIGLVGPLGLEGYARITPYPYDVIDTRGALAVRLGPVAVSGGWRHLYVDGGKDLTSFRFSGPEIGLAFLF